MRKLLAVCIIGLSLGTASVFADHPGGWGVGILGRGGSSWDFGRGGLGGAALSLKAPMLPIYWGINLDLNGNYFGFGLTGDYYFKEGLLAPDIGFGYYIGIGGYLGFGTENDTWVGGKYVQTNLDFGVRVPLGLNIVIPIDPIKLEVFFDVAPSLGLVLFFWDSKYDVYYKDYEKKSHLGLGGGIAAELGVRVWF